MSKTPGPIEAAITHLRTWLERASGAPVRIGPPGEPVAAGDRHPDGLSLWPLELRSGCQTQGVGARHPYRLTVRCVVASEDPAAFAPLDRVLTAAVLAGDPPLSPDDPDPSLWSALRVTPRPVLVFDLAAPVTHPTSAAPLVAGPLTLKNLDLLPLIGEVRGPGNQPVAGLRIEVVGTGLSAYTDRHGRFRVPGVPAGGRVELLLRGRGRTFTAEVDLGNGDPVIVHTPFTADLGNHTEH